MRSKGLWFSIILVVAVVGGAIALKLAPSATAVIWSISNGGTKLWPLVSISALIDSINPCAFSILLVTIAFLLSLGMGRASIIKIGGTYIAGIFAAYFLIGLGLLQALHLFNTPHFMGKLGALLLIGLGLISIINEIFPSFPIKPRIPKAVHGKIADLLEKSTLPAAFFLGVLVGLCEFPCTGGPYLMVIGLLHDSRTYWQGFLYLLWYNAIFVLPLVSVLLLAGNKTVVDNLHRWKRENVKKAGLIGGILMIAFGLFILFV